tara:strand:- start:187 stop:999 length:813 start_codon:yes stop_codon:yes gene_type:complete
MEFCMNRTLLVFSLLLSLASCRSSKVAEPAYTKSPKIQVLIDSVIDGHFEFDFFSSKIAGKYKDDAQSFSFKGTIKIKKDSLIWMSISPGLGLELARVLFDTDSLHFMNRFDKTYFKSSYADLSKKIQSPLSYARIQDLLMGNSLSEFEERKYHSTLEDQLFKICSVSDKHLKKMNRSRRKPNQEVFTAFINPLNSRISAQSLSNLNLNRTLLISYDDFEVHDNQYFSESINVNIVKNKGLSLNLAYSKINLSKKLKFSFKVPKSYEVIR